MLRLKIGAHPHAGEPVVVELHREDVSEKWGLQWDEESYKQRRHLARLGTSRKEEVENLFDIVEIRRALFSNLFIIQISITTARHDRGLSIHRVNDSTSRMDMRQELSQRLNVEMALLPPPSVQSSSSDLDWLIKATYSPRTRITEIASSMPPCLIVHIWRDKFFTGVKDTTYVSFDRHLRTLETPDGRQIYHLTGVVEHLGYRLDSGHYVAYVARDAPDGEQWYFCSDSVVEPISFEEVATKHAYLLFYVRMD
ncbi:hypothetical protein Pmar_PMAR002242 [Perkinsus marinus ATCC 50983]|uniref:USP domain-containing protein n=1 Tax=Perkinsus marinus (strain ATCC 50983 / TXsc) TaxID=423536 RepID=C5K6Y0_PERM5|nr:hypothetical protein Pmar_PMAR002242 [Perkinsus marinus ATCC 50983]EER19766.1 hypothetical protein Pmar_PMAR002242 [Perkinsus marinus ATCC 50983]|eukprot:XP_002787970.1 hypothetical protein Pmar_PMAR002242 [Perkinsus marinus ATCC 50983]